MYAAMANTKHEMRLLMHLQRPMVECRARWFFFLLKVKVGEIDYLPSTPKHKK